MKKIYRIRLTSSILVDVIASNLDEACEQAKEEQTENLLDEVEASYDSERPLPTPNIFGP